MGDEQRLAKHAGHQRRRMNSWAGVRAEDVHILNRYADLEALGHGYRWAITVALRALTLEG